MRLHFLNSAVIANSKMGYTDTLLLRTVFLVPGGMRALTFSPNSTRLIRTLHNHNHYQFIKPFW